MIERIFNDENEPFWRSAKQMELGVIAPPLFRGYIESQFERTGRGSSGRVDRRARATLGHPYATQELCYFLWEETARKVRRRPASDDGASRKLLRSEHAHFGLVWEARARSGSAAALAREPVGR